MRFSTTGFLSALLALTTAAYTNPDYSTSPTGNAILKPGLDELVPARKPYTITWNPTTEGLISLVLLRGASTNVIPIATIAEEIPNDGEYTWNPSPELELDTTHYGILLVVESARNKGQYQYSTQFGIENPDFEEDAGAGATTNAGTSSSGPNVTATATASSGTPRSSNALTETTSETSEATETTVTSEAPSTAAAASTTITAMTTTASPSPNTIEKQNQNQNQEQDASTTAGPEYTGAAHRNAISLGAAAAGVAAALAF